jgi:RHS repeat-associated protein
MIARQFSGAYRYGFNGMEKENAVNEDGYDFGARLLNTWNGKFLSIDPYSAKFPSESNYIFAGNNPVYFIDVKGKYKYPADKEAEYRNNYPMITLYLSNYVQNDVMKSDLLVNSLIQYSKDPSAHRSDMDNFKGYTRQSIERDVEWDNPGSPDIVFLDVIGSGLRATKQAAGHYDRDTETIQINSSIAKFTEDILAGDYPHAVKEAALFAFFSLLMHETTHRGDYEDNKQTTGDVGRVLEDKLFRFPYINGAAAAGVYNTLNAEGELNKEAQLDNESVIKLIQGNDETKTLIPSVPE